MKERPILMSAPMVHAILEDRKTQTRRIYNPKRDDAWKPGMTAWVKETFYDSRLVSKRRPWTYRADTSADEDLSRDFAWKPSIFMPRIASRITLEITDVRVDRLQDISGDDCAAEGIEPQGIGSDMAMIAAYRKLWDSINEKGSWAINPWVWVISFKRIRP